MSQVFNLAARQHDSRVLGAWLDADSGRRARAGGRATLQANAVQTDLTAEQLMSVLGLTGASAAGVQVTADTALRVSTVYGCVALIAGAIASMPLNVYERAFIEGQGETRQPAKHDYHWLLNEQACEEMTSATAWEYLASARLFYGDGFAELLRPGVASSRVIGWRPLHPWQVTPFRDSDDALYYRVQPRTGAAYVLDPADMIHVPSLGFDGLTSPSPITYAAREAVGNAIAAERWSGKFFSEGATFDYALKTAATLKNEQVEMLKASILARVQGSRGPLILTGGLEPAQLSVNPKDAEILGTRLFSVEEICRILGVPPFMVGHTQKTTSWGSGIEEMGSAFVRYTLRRHLTPIAQEFNRKLWPTRARYFVDHDTTALERGNTKTRFEGYRIALGRAGEPGWMSPNEVRRLENQPPIEGGDTITQGGQSAEPTPAAAG